MATLGEATKRRMAELEIGPDEFSERSDIARTTLFAILADRAEPTFRTLRKLRAAGVKIPRSIFDSAA